MGKQKIKNNNKLKRKREYGYKNITIGKKKSRSNAKLVCCLLGAIIVYFYDLSKSGIPHITYLNPIKITTIFGWTLGESVYYIIKNLLKDPIDRFTATIETLKPFVKTILILTIVFYVSFFIGVDFIFSIPQINGSLP